MSQQRDIEVLSQRNRASQSQLETLEGGGGSSTEFETPPHY